jgi:hypothetical protein
VGETAVTRLSQLGLTVELLSGAAGRGDDGRQECTIFHPVQSKGHRMWSDTTAALRGACLGLADGWKIDRTNNFETAAHAGRAIAIAVVGGDEFTGWRGPKDPKVRRKRGPMTTKRVRDNYLGMEPLFPIKASLSDDEQPDSWQTWFFLIRATDEALWLELSQPIGLDNAGYVSDWSERIILPRLPVSGGVTPIPDDGEDDDPFTISKK